MSTRIPLPYSKKVLELFRNPKNLGPIENPTVVSAAGSPACGDMIKFYIRIEREGDKDIIKDIGFESYGCAANIAAASIATEMVKEKDLRYAWSITWKQISDALEGLPPIKFHCSILAIGALKRAIRAYYRNRGEQPDWLPKDLVAEEKMVLEEEEMVERYYKATKAFTEKGLIEQQK